MWHFSLVCLVFLSLLVPWVRSEDIRVQNEKTAQLPDHGDKVAFREILSAPPKNDAADLGTAKSVDESLKTFEVIGNGRLEIVAAEPQIADPVAFDWGPNGELWVVEMGDYPNGANWHGPGDNKGDAGGRVKLLLDIDADGYFETSHLFLDGLGVPTGVKAFRQGVLVTVAPNIIYAEDTDGDHIADKQQVLYEGLTEGNHQHRANGLRWGLDSWIHVANGDSGGLVRSTKTGKTVNIRGRDFKIHPDTGGMELTAGTSQFGRSRDNQGNWFSGNNSEPVWHYVLDARYQARNEFVSSPSSRHVTSKNPGAAPVYPTSKTTARFNDFDRADRFTSACSTEVSRHDGEKQKFVYVCEPVHNLVHRSELIRNGVSFTSDRADNEQGQEFLTSTDNWFRPVMVRYGPDDAIWIADMYRQVIEHPEWIPLEWQRKIDHLAGNDKGRIYRVVFDSEKESQADAWKSIGSMSRQQLPKHLDTPNGVMRDMLQQQICEQLPLMNSGDLLDAFQNARWPHARLAIIHLLREDGERLQQCLTQGFEQNQVNPRGLQVAVRVINRSEEMRALLFAWLDATELKAEDRIPLAYLLGDMQDVRAAEWLARLAVVYGEDPYVRAAVMSGISPRNVAEFTDQVFQQLRATKLPVSGTPLLGDIVSAAVGMRDTSALLSFVNVVRLVEEPSEKLNMLSVLRVSLDRHEKRLDEIYGGAELQMWREVAILAPSAAANVSLSIDARRTAISLFGLVEHQKPVERSTLQSLLNPLHPPKIQAQAIQMIRQLGDGGDAVDIFASWNALSPTIRSVAISEILRDDRWTEKLLNRMETGVVSTRDIGLQQQRQLREHKDQTIRERAAKLFKRVSSDRDAVVRRHLEQPLTADSLRGKVVFEKQCTACHLLEGQGRAVGPDLVALSDKSRTALLTAILDPNRAVEEKYLDYSLVLQSGEVHQGLLAEESATSITLATANGERKELLRNRIELMKSTGKSLMPEGLEQVLSPQDIEDVIHYVQSVRADRKIFPGNDPQIAPVRDDGSVRLFAMHAEIYGPSLVLEPKYRNLGFWRTDQDRAVWSVHAKQAGRYEVNLDYACAPEHAGNQFRLRVNGQELSGVIPGTGSWDVYRSKNVGAIWLPAEPVQISFTSAGSVNGFLCDLRTIVLWPD